MFIPNLDETTEWEGVELFSSPTGLFNYHHFTDLTLRSDALQIEITTSVASVEYKFGGELFQLWEFNNSTYQIAYRKLWMNNKNIVAIEPVGNSRLLYHPPTYLYNWTIDVKARRYEASSNNAEIDFGEVLNRLDSLQQQFVLELEIINTNAVDAFNSSTQQRLDLLQQINQMDAGVYTLAEGIADLLPGDRGQEIRQNTQKRLNLDLGFL